MCAFHLRLLTHMALEDICGFKERRVHQFPPLSSLEDSTSSTQVADCYNLKWKRLKTSENTSPHVFMPSIPCTSSFINRATDDPSVPTRRPFPLCHGTTTLGFIFQGGVIAAADTRASAGGLVACPAVHKITPIHSHLVVTSSGSGADCMLWERILIREIRLYQLRHGRRLSIRGSAKLLSFMLHPFKGTDVCVALTLCGWDKEEVGINFGKTLEDTSFMTDSSGVISSAPDSLSPNRGPKLFYVCSDGARLQGDVFSVGSGSPYAYGVLDGNLSWGLNKEDAISLAREAVSRAAHRDAYSGNNVDLFLVTGQGWFQRKREDLKEEYYRDMERWLKDTRGKGVKIESF